MNAPPKTAISVAELAKKIGTVIGVSNWHVVTQDMIDRFADVTSDYQFIHVDPRRAKKETPFGGTIAHGYLTLSLVAPMSYEALPQIEGRAMGINYGLDKVRFLAPVRSGARVRAHFKLKEVTPRSEKEILLKNEVTVELEGADKPAIYAESLSVIVLK
jgi:acyl dehydratase